MKLTAKAALAAPASMAFENTAQEKRLTDAIKNAVGLDVRAHETILIASARDLIRKKSEDVARVQAAADQLEDVRRRIAKRTDDDLDDLLQEWAAADQQARYLMI